MAVFCSFYIDLLFLAYTVLICLQFLEGFEMWVQSIINCHFTRPFYLCYLLLPTVQLTWRCSWISHIPLHDLFLCCCIRGDANACSKTQEFLVSGQIMREESLRLASTPCQPLPNTLCKEECYVVQSTGAVVTLNSSVQLIYYFCSKLPSDESVFFLRQGFLMVHTKNIL